MTDHRTTPPAYPFDAPGLEPPSQFAYLRRHEPISRVTALSGQPAWLLIHYADIRAVLADSRFRVGFPSAPDTRDEPMNDNNTFFQDPPKHTRLRRQVASAFTVARVERLRAFTTRTATCPARKLALAPSAPSG